MKWFWGISGTLKAFQDFDDYSFFRHRKTIAFGMIVDDVICGGQWSDSLLEAFRSSCRYGHGAPRSKLLRCCGVLTTCDARRLRQRTRFTARKTAFIIANRDMENPPFRRLHIFIRPTNSSFCFCAHILRWGRFWHDQRLYISLNKTCPKRPTILEGISYQAFFSNAWVRERQSRLLP